MLVVAEQSYVLFFFKLHACVICAQIVTCTYVHDINKLQGLRKYGSTTYNKCTEPSEATLQQ